MLPGLRTVYLWYLAKEYKYLFVSIAISDRSIDKCNLCFKLPLLGEPYRVIINNISTADSGRYGCMAANAVSYSFSEDKINVECKFHCENVLEISRVTISVPICICCSYHTFESRMY